MNRTIHTKYRPDIDGLRAIAVMSVLFFHAFPNSFTGGFVGVDIFFVISGYLISGIILNNLEHNNFSFTEFYKRRIKRIFPALILVLFSCLAFGWFALFSDEYLRLGEHIVGGAGFIANIQLSSEFWYFEGISTTNPILHLWSLGIEEQFYILWPFLLWAMWKNRANSLAIIITIAITSFVLEIYTMHENVLVAFYSPQTRFWELMIGSLLAYIELHKKNFALPKINNEIKSCLGFALITTAIFFLTEIRTMELWWWGLIPTIGTALLISAGPQAWINRALLSRPSMVRIGLISFPLYLWHWPLLSFARIITQENIFLDDSVTIIILAMILAQLTYEFIEKPIRFSNNKIITPLLITLMFTIGLAGYLCFKFDGFRFRNANKSALNNRFYQPYKEDCRKLTHEKYNDDWCNHGTGFANPSTVMIGDSFSNSYSTMLNAYSKTSNNFSFIQFGRGQCPSLNNYGPKYCREITQKSNEYIKNTSSVTTVILASSWHYYSDGKYFRQSNYHESAESFKIALEETIKDYQASGKKVIILLPQPTGLGVRNCIRRPIQLAGNFDEKCQLAREIAEQKEGDYREYIIKISNQYHVPYFDPFNYLCDEKICKFSDAGKILYTDESHLGIYGGEFLAIKAKNELDELFKQ